MSRRETALLDEFERTTPWTVLRRNHELLPGFMQFGEGDMLAKDADDSLVAIECKWIDNTSTGKTAKVRRTKHRKKVVEQALRHASYVKIGNHDRRVRAATLTNEDGLTLVSGDVSLSDAKRCVLDFLGTVWHGYIPQCAVPQLQRLFAASH
jgi:hypothetical protein